MFSFLHAYIYHGSLYPPVKGKEETGLKTCAGNVFFFYSGVKSETLQVGLL